MPVKGAGHQIYEAVARWEEVEHAPNAQSGFCANPTTLTLRRKPEARNLHRISRTLWVFE